MWIAFPLFLVSQELNVAQVGVVVEVHSAAYFLQVYTGRLGDQVGRKPPIVVGFFLAGAGVLGMILIKDITHESFYRGLPAWGWCYTIQT